MYPSSVCMTVVPAVVAGVDGDRALHAAAAPTARSTPPVLYAARAGGRDLRREDRRRAGGRGDGVRDRVDPARSTGSSGPGNAYVTEAKRQVAGFVGIDGLAGPSELAIVADGDVDPRMAALDLIAQAEHDPEARTFFVTTDAAADRDGRRGARARRCRRRAVARSSTPRSRYTRAVLVRDLDQAAEVVNDLAAEHLQLLLPEPDAFLAEGPQRRRDLPRAVDRGAVRRLRRRLEPRAADRGHRPLLQRAARRRLRDGHARWSR